MTDAVYHLTAIVLATLGVVRGFRGGFTSQVPSVIGFAFGLVCARLFLPPVEECLWELLPEFRERLCGDMFVELLACSLVFVVVFSLLLSLSSLLRSALSLLDTGLLNSLAGAVVCMVKYLFFLSMFYNLLADFNPYSSLTKYASDNDGNVVQIVMYMAPGSFGVPGVRELCLRRKFDEAKYISFNEFHPVSNIRFRQC